MNDEELEFEEIMSLDEDLDEEKVVGKVSLDIGDRQRVEDKLEELRLQRLEQDYDFM